MNDVAHPPATIHAPSHAAMSFEDMCRLARSVAKSGLFGIKTEDQALSLMALAQAEGRHPATVARDYHIIAGTPSKKAEAMARDFLTSGGKIEWHELNDAAVEATFSHPIGGSVRLRWDEARIQQAQLGGNPMHKKYPRQMKRSRLVSEGVRTVWPMATSGMYEPGEVADFSPSRGEPIDVTPKADLDAFAAATTQGQTKPPAFTAIDGDGVEHEYATATSLDEALRTILADAAKRGRPHLEAMGENNVAALEQLRAAGEADTVDGLSDFYNELIDHLALSLSSVSVNDAASATPAEQEVMPHSDKGQDVHNAKPPSIEVGGDLLGGAIDEGWLAAVARLKPEPTDLPDILDWGAYVDAFVALCGTANAATRGALQVSKLPAMQKLRTIDGDQYRRATQALAGR